MSFQKYPQNPIYAKKAKQASHLNEERADIRALPLKSSTLQRNRSLDNKTDDDAISNRRNCSKENLVTVSFVQSELVDSHFPLPLRMWSPTEPAPRNILSKTVAANSL